MSNCGNGPKASFLPAFMPLAVTLQFFPPQGQSPFPCPYLGRVCVIFFGKGNVSGHGASKVAKMLVWLGWPSGIAAVKTTSGLACWPRRRGRTCGQSQAALIHSGLVLPTPGVGASSAEVRRVTWQSHNPHDCENQ